jgi:hypothetical protein
MAWGDARSDRAMVYRAAINVSHHRDRKPSFGDVGSEWFGAVLADAMRSVDERSGDLHVRSDAVWVDEAVAQVGASFLAGESGQRGVMQLADVPDRTVNRTEDDTQSVRCGVALELPLDRSAGLLAVFIPHRGRSIQGVLGPVLKRAAGEHGLTLTFSPVVPVSVLREAIENGLLRMTLTRYGRPSDRSLAGLVETDDVQEAIKTVDIRPSSRGFIRPGDDLRSILDGSGGDVVTIDGEDYHEGQITVDLGGGYLRTFSLFDPQADRGFALKVVLDKATPAELDESGRTAESIRAALTTKAIPTGRTHA